MVRDIFCFDRNEIVNEPIKVVKSIKHLGVITDKQLKGDIHILYL